MIRFFLRFSVLALSAFCGLAGADEDGIRTVSLPDGRSLSFREFGNPNGPLVFYFHGLPGSHMEAKLIADEIRRAGLRVVSVDRPGIAQSTYQADRKMTDWPRDISYLADRLGYRKRKFGILAVSGGTPYGCVCALEMGPRISHLAIVTPFAPVEAEGVEKSSLNFLLQFGARHPNIAKLVLRSQNKRLQRNPDKAAKKGVRPFLPEERSFVLDQPQVKQDSLSNLEQISHQGPRGVVTEIKLLANPWGFEISHIRGVSVSIWAGGRDEIAPVSMAQYFRDEISGSRLHVNPETGHLSTFKEQAGRILSRF